MATVRLIGAAALLFGLAGCSLLPDAARWEEEEFRGVSAADVLAVCVLQLDRDYAIARSDLTEGVVETDWEPDAVAPRSRRLRRERVVARVEPTDGGARLRLRVETQVRPYTGILDPDLTPREDWEDAPDDVRRAQILMQRVRSALRRPGASTRFTNE